MKKLLHSIAPPRPVEITREKSPNSTLNLGILKVIISGPDNTEQISK